MCKPVLFTTLGVLTILLLPAAGVAGVADDGACILLVDEQPVASDPTGIPGGILCADLTLAECEQLCPDEDAPVGNLTIVDCEWLNGIPCGEEVPKLGDPWEGACTAPQSPIGPVCFVIAEDLDGYTAEEICDQVPGVWEEGALCAAPVPAVPRAALAALSLALVLGALTALGGRIG